MARILLVSQRVARGHGTVGLIGLAGLADGGAGFIFKNQGIDPKWVGTGLLHAGATYTYFSNMDHLQLGADENFEVPETTDRIFNSNGTMEHGQIR